GEKLPDIEPFEPERLAGRILGMGDMLTLIERAQDSISEDEAASMQRKLDEGQFDFEDFLDQLRQVKKLGPLTDILSMLPGANRMMKDVDPNMAEDSLKRTEAIINSMTAQERRSPDILNGSRRRRIATGSGTTVQDVNTLIKQFREMQKMMKQMGIMGGGKKGKGGRRARGAMSDVMKMFNMN
ncbi:MAG: signal recognition particle protein, partial [Amphiplicatus sp.]|nr:signal recognition particle protein [Amphiplicatus sp.]